MITTIKSVLTNPATPPAKSLAILNAQQEELSKNRQDLNKKQQVINESPDGIDKDRLDRANREAIAANERQQADIQKRRNEIEATEARNLEEIQRINNEAKLRQEHLITEQRLAVQCLEMFNYTINRLHDKLKSYQNDSGLDISTDIEFPTPYNLNST